MFHGPFEDGNKKHNGLAFFGVDNPITDKGTLIPEDLNHYSTNYSLIPSEIKDHFGYAFFYPFFDFGEDIKLKELEEKEILIE